MEHTDIPAGEIHTPYQWVVADAAARTALVPVSGDQYKLCLQLDDRSEWLLTVVSPAAWRLRSGSALTVTAGAALGGHRMVVLNGGGVAIYADCTEATHAGKVLGMTLGAIADGDSGDVLRSGEVVEPSWNWTLDAPVFLGTAGQLTQVQPVSGFSQIVGFPVSTTKLFVSLREPITLL